MFLSLASMTGQIKRNGEGWDQATIKKMEIEDVEGAFHITVTMTFNPWSKKMILEEIAHPFSHCFLLHQSTEPGETLPLGFLCFRQVGEESELLNLCIGPEFRQRGLGKRLMSFYINFCEGKGVNTYFLEVGQSNTPAIHLYRSFGFRPLGKRKNFYQGKYDALLMTRKVS